MNKVLLISIIFGLFCNAVFSITADEILQKADGNRSVGLNFEMKISMEDYKNGQLSDKTIMKGFVKGNDKSMVVYTDPSNMKGRKILMIGDDMWLFIPNTQKPVRLTASQRLLGQASNGDVVKVRFSYDYSAELAGEETVNIPDNESSSCYKLDMTAKRTSATYHKMMLWIAKDTYYPIKAEFFALSGKKLKTAYYSNPKEIEGRTVITKTSINDEIIKENFTTIEYLELKTVSVEDKYFNKEYLQRM